MLYARISHPLALQNVTFLSRFPQIRHAVENMPTSIESALLDHALPLSSFLTFSVTIIYRSNYLVPPRYAFACSISKYGGFRNVA